MDFLNNRNKEKSKQLFKAYGECKDTFSCGYDSTSRVLMMDVTINELGY